MLDRGFRRFFSRITGKSRKHTYTYSVKPVYTVFNERVLGEEATAQVVFVPLGTILSIR